MSRHNWKMLEFPVDKTFKFRHGVAWVVYVWLLKWNLEMLWEARQANVMYLLPAIALSWASVLTAAGFIENWLDGANRHVLFRIALVLSAVLSCALAVWMTWHYSVLLFVGVTSFFQRPFELLSITLFVERFGIVGMGVVTFAVYAYLSARLVFVLMSGEKNVNFEQVLGEQSIGGPEFPQLPLRADELPLVQKNPQYVDLGIAIRRGFNPTILSPENNFKRAFVGPPKPPDKPGKQRYLSRPVALMPKLSLNYTTYGPPILQGMSYRGGTNKGAFEQCRALGWAAFEWVLRTQPNLQEVMYALEALPNIARVVDEADALEARDWISRLGDHPGSLEIDLPWRDAADGPERTRTVRIADVAMQTLVDWDHARRPVRRN